MGGLIAREKEGGRPTEVRGGGRVIGQEKRGIGDACYE